MASNPTLAEALQAAITDYNVWAVEKARGYDPVRAYGELRGIFFNKLLTRLREIEGFFVIHRSYYGKVIETDDFLCELNPSCSLTRLRVIPPTSGVSAKRADFLLELRRLSDTMVYEALPSMLEYDIAGIVNQIKAYKV